MKRKTEDFKSKNVKRTKKIWIKKITKDREDEKAKGEKRRKKGIKKEEKKFEGEKNKR